MYSITCYIFRYEFESFLLHWGNSDKGGSEHSIDSRFFSGELQLLGFNTELSSNVSQASQKPYGLVGVAILIEEVESPSKIVNPALARIVKAAGKVRI